jgi:hypothetical protein
MHTITRRPAPTRDLSLASDRYEAIDALHRFAAGQDLRDLQLLASAFTPDAWLDFTQPARKFGVEMPVVRGRQAIVSTLGAALADLDTTHTVSNARVAIDGAAASLHALVEAQHLARADHSRHLLLKNHYWVDLERSGDGWAIATLRIVNAWHRGDPAVLFPDRVPTGGGR